MFALLAPGSVAFAQGNAAESRASAAAAEHPAADAASLEGTFEIELPVQPVDAPRAAIARTLNGRWRITLTKPLPPMLSLAAQAVLHVVVVPAAELSVDERSLGLVSSTQLPIAPGNHSVRIDHPEYQPLQRKLSLLPGQTQRLVVDLAEDAVRLRRRDREPKRESKR